jgi:16S rRNA (adenine1518-N6/adenine1519-N6)-dimethyltransferase
MSAHIPRKRFGQHFLCDQAVVQHIVAALAPKVGEHLVEIGPGQGAMTLPILKLVKQLDVVELDRDLIPELEERTRRAGHLNVHEADALQFNFATLKNDSRLLRVFGNLPYNISTPLIFHLLSFSNVVADMLFMLQKEVAQRLAASPSSAHYGRLSVMTQYHCEVHLLFDVSPNAFFPPPQVQSSIVKLLPYRELPCKANDYAVFESVVKQAFGQRRKTLRNSLKSLIDSEMWSQVSVRSEQRPEELGVKEFVELSNIIK